MHLMQELEPTPSQELETPPVAKSTPEPKDDSALKIVEAIVHLNAHANPEKAAADSLYEFIKDDRPIKLTAEQSGFKRGAGADGMSCKECWSYVVFTGKQRKKVQHGACEITRPNDGDLGIKPDDSCTFFSLDGVELPKRATEKPAPAPNSSAVDRQATAEDTP